MSQATEGAVAPASDASASSRPDAPNGPLPFVVTVDPACIEAGYNAAGPTLMSIDVANLPPRLRRTLRGIVEGSDYHPHWTQARALTFRGAGIEVPASTAEAFVGVLSMIHEAEDAEERELERERALTGLVGAGLRRILPRFEPDATFYATVDEVSLRFPDRVNQALVEDLGPALEAAWDALHEAMIRSRDTLARLRPGTGSRAPCRGRRSGRGCGTSMPGLSSGHPRPTAGGPTITGDGRAPRWPSPSTRMRNGGAPHRRKG